MGNNVIITTVVGVAEGLAASALKNYRSDDRDEPLIGRSRAQSILDDFTSFDYKNDILFDGTDLVFEQFSPPEDSENDKVVNFKNETGLEWREHRPCYKTWFKSCIRVSFYLTLISSMIGILACFIMFIDINTADVCNSVNIYNIPKPIQQIKVVCQALEGHQSQYFHILTMTLTFGFKLMHKLHLIYWNIFAAFCDTFYRFLAYMFGIYDEYWKRREFLKTNT